MISQVGRDSSPSYSSSYAASHIALSSGDILAWCFNEDGAIKEVRPYAET